MMKDIRDIQGETFCQESEDLEKVKKAFMVFFPEKTVKMSSTSGMYGTKLKILRTKVPRKHVEELSIQIIKGLSKQDKNLLRNEIKNRLDEKGNFYIRFDKQAAYEKGMMSLADPGMDSIKVVISVNAHPASEAGYVLAINRFLEQYL